jgi:hypothetical protein
MNQGLIGFTKKKPIGFYLFNIQGMKKVSLEMRCVKE